MEVSILETPTSCSENEVIFSHEDLPHKESVAKAEALMLPPSFYLYEKKLKCAGCRGCSEDYGYGAYSVSRFILDTAEPKPEEEVIHSVLKDTTSVLSEASGGTREQHTTGNLLNLTGMLSFADLAKEKPTRLEKKGNFQFQGSGNQLFSSQQGDTDASVEYDPNVDSKPSVSVPDSYEYKSINDSKVLLFEHRCKLFRYDRLSQQWKERGLGNIQILQLPLTKKSRIVMRREQILKVCCNHYITEDMTLTSKDNDRCWTWQSLADFSEESPKQEMFVVRFKKASVAEKFKNLFEDCVKRASLEKSGSRVVPETQPSSREEKVVRGWKCIGCCSLNLTPTMTCKSCCTLRPCTQQCKSRL